jgi:hypothetical protein
VSLSLTSDIVADVIRAAEPNREKLAREKLENVDTNREVEFDTHVDGQRSNVVRAEWHSMGPVIDHAPHSAVSGPVDMAVRGLSEILLARYIEEMMPASAARSATGTGTAGAIWKSFFAREIAHQMILRGVMDRGTNQAVAIRHHG